MKITINTEKEAKPQKTVYKIRSEIADKLNELAGSGDFFTWENEHLRVKGCANVQYHNKLIILLALFSDSLSDEYSVYTSFLSSDSYISFRHYNTFEKLQSLQEFVDSIPDLKEVKIEIN